MKKICKAQKNKKVTMRQKSPKEKELYSLYSLNVRKISVY